MFWGSYHTLLTCPYLGVSEEGFWVAVTPSSSVFLGSCYPQLPLPVEHGLRPTLPQGENSSVHKMTNVYVGEVGKEVIERHPGRATNTKHIISKAYERVVPDISAAEDSHTSFTGDEMQSILKLTKILLPVQI